MIHWIRPKMESKYLVIAGVLVLAGLFLVQGTAVRVRHPSYEQQVLAARIMQDSLAVIRQARLELEIPLDLELDPNETGLIGERFTMITTSLGNLEAKRTSTSPAFAALLVRFFHEAGLEQGATVAIGASGSFPGLIVATLAACQAMDLEPLVFYSVGASQYGANIPGFTFLDMLQHLQERGIFAYGIHLISLGGDNDRGEGMLFSEAQSIMLEIAQKAEAPFLFPENTADSVKQRLALYKEYNHGRSPEIFVNIGGAVPNIGNTSASLHLPSGLVKYPPVKTEHPERGLVFEYLEQGIPVIHLLNIRDLALNSGIVVDPVPFPSLGSEDVYFITKYNSLLIWGSVATTLGILLYGLKKRR